MIVALRAAHSSSQKGFTRDVHDIADHVAVCLVAICWFIIALHQSHEPSSYFGRNITIWEFIARELFRDKAIIGFIVIEGLNHIISVAPYVWLFVVSLKTIGLGVTHRIQPETC